MGSRNLETRPVTSRKMKHYAILILTVWSCAEWGRVDGSSHPTTGPFAGQHSRPPPQVFNPPPTPPPAQQSPPPTPPRNPQESQPAVPDTVPAASSPTEEPETTKKCCPCKTHGPVDGYGYKPKYGYKPQNDYYQPQKGYYQPPRYGLVSNYGAPQYEYGLVSNYGTPQYGGDYSYGQSYGYQDYQPQPSYGSYGSYYP